MTIAKQLENAAITLRDAVDALSFSEPVTHVYNPLAYAWESHLLYIRRFGNSKKKVVFLGMNPGPFGMAQTGVPFGEIAAVRDWMGITAPVGKPPVEHKKRPVDGFDCPKSEVSGRRLWGLMMDRFGAPENFFADHYVINYCPLLFLDGSDGKCRNLTPDKLKASDVKDMYAACDDHLRSVLDALQPEWLIGVGGFGEQKLADLNWDKPHSIGKILHPSPASPAANRGWAEAATKQLSALGL
ncbi:uracil-DNA glycosylase family protein [Cerasicoccus maritimus]|uniref:uracil-DNA glycosylase family protein n=1 Tax=Cerasicoccus maritimus TaxID=490089 RepID=UPI002852D8ED|nr:uracil-DNA glycosylase family protein [Cerasicoccus maritimus]